MAEEPFTAFAGDCIVRATVDLPEGQRLSDVLNDATSVALTKVQLEALDDGRVVALDDLDLELNEVCAVVAPGTYRGSGSHRIRTRTARVEIQLGPYEVLGHLHGPTSGDPLLSVSRRKPMIPLTGATIAYELAGHTRMFDVDVIVINRNMAQVVKQVAYEPSKIDEYGFSKVDPNAKDLTFELSMGIRDG
jgi:hypothetical protein